jgi:hypothetical protein
MAGRHADGKIALKGSGTLSTGEPVRFVMYAYRGCDPGMTTGCQAGGHRFRIVVRPAAAGPIPADTIEYDNVPAGNNDVDLAVPQSLVRGTITILRRDAVPIRRIPPRVRRTAPREDEPMPDTSTVMRVHVEHRMFVAFDPRHPVGPLDDVPADADFLVAGAGGLVLCSAGNDF